jgi:hypothetical protein
MADAEMKNLELLFAFEILAEQKGLCIERNADDSGFKDSNTASTWLGFEAAHGDHGCRPVGQQLYAGIKKNSRYASQVAWAERDGEYPFRVHIQDVVGDYCVQGGPGGQYRLIDVNLYVVDNGKQCRIK